jgi:hypothetical protein
MAIPSSRSTFKDYCLRNLGAPVIEINVDDDQLEDRIDEALDIFRLYHYDGIEKVYLKHQITASTLKITSSNGLSFAGNSKIVGQTSSVSATVYGSQNGVLPYNTDQNILYVARLLPVVTGRPVGPSIMFTPGETITGTNAAGQTITGTISTATDWFTPGDIENRYIPIADSVYGVLRVMPLFQGTSSSKSIFDLQYQLRLNDLYDLSSTSLIYYTTVMQHLATLDLLLNGKPIYRFNRLENRLQIDIDWVNGQKIDVGNYVIVEAYRGLDPTEFTKVWNEPWLKRYVTALFKRQWGTNLKKFSGLQLPGGVTLDGNLLYNEANVEIKSLEDELQNKSAPLDFMMG